MKKIFTLLSGVLLSTFMLAKAEKVTCYVQDYNYNELAQPFESELIKNADGSLTLSEFFNSGNPVSFTYTTPNVDSSSDITFTGKLDTSDYYPYLLDPNGDYMVCYAYTIGGGADDYTTIWYPYACDHGYSYVWRYDMTDPDNVYEYYGSICLAGTLDDSSSSPYYYINFYYNEPETSGIENISIDENAPVEYFNLQGVRVDNPANGLYIRRQGNTATKVLVK